MIVRSWSADRKVQPLRVAWALWSVCSATPGGRELAGGLRAVGIVAQRGVERGRSGQLAQLHRGDGAAPGGDAEGLGGMDDLPDGRHVADHCELDHFDVAHHGDARHRTSVAPWAAASLRGSR